MTKIDWSGELEAYHEDGRVVPVTFVEDDGGNFLPMMVDGAPSDIDCPYDDRFFNKDGTRKESKWRIRNRQPTANDRLARLEAFVARVADGGPMLALGHYDEAKALVAEIAPIDPDEAEAEKIWQSVGYTDIGPAHDLRKVAIAAIKRGRALERGEP